MSLEFLTVLSISDKFLGLVNLVNGCPELGSCFKDQSIFNLISFSIFSHFFLILMQISTFKQNLAKLQKTLKFFVYQVFGERGNIIDNDKVLNRAKTIHQVRYWSEIGLEQGLCELCMVSTVVKIVKNKKKYIIFTIYSRLC